MKKLLILLFSILISFNSYGETESEYYSNGQIKSEKNKNGKWTWWDKNGQIKSEAIFKDGVCISGECWFF